MQGQVDAMDAIPQPALIKPRLRGWLHFGAAPLALVLGLVLVVLTPEQDLRAAVAVYVLTTVLLFGVSAAYHLGAGSPGINAFLRRLDHANIYLFIAGSYTPFAMALEDRALGWLILGLVWGIALIGLLLPMLWMHAPRWITAGSYIALGWVAVFFLPDLYRAFGPWVVTLIGLGGVLYTDRRGRLRPQAPQPVTWVVRVPRAVPRLHDRRLPGAVLRGRARRPALSRGWAASDSGQPRALVPWASRCASSWHHSPTSPR